MLVDGQQAGWLTGQGGDVDEGVAGENGRTTSLNGCSTFNNKP